MGSKGCKDHQLKDSRAAPDSEIPPRHRESFAMNDATGQPRGERDIDKIDRRILRVLQADGRISNLKLAEEVHLSPTAVLERVKRLHREGYILGYEARLNPTKLGAGLLVFVEILLDRTVHDVMDTFKAAVQVRPEILEAHLVAGGFDYLLKTRVADMAAYREFIGSVIWTLPGVRETRTYAVMEEVKNTSLLPV
jgi:Lrp/AsnC family transcriptional regulator, leucine-responsive regulatory protein